MKFLFVKQEADPDATSGGSGQPPEPPKADSEQPKQPEQPKADPEPPKLISLDELKEALKGIIPELPKVEPEQPEQPKQPEPPKADPETNSVIWDLYVKSNNVPDELVPLLPTDLAKLKTYLESDKYKQAAAKLKAASTIQPPNGDNQESKVTPPKDKPEPQKPAKTFREITSDMLSEFDKFI